MNRIISKIGNVLQLVLAAPIKLPGKTLNIVKYVALGLGIIESVLKEEDQKLSATEEDRVNNMDNISQAAAEAPPHNKEKNIVIHKEGGVDENQ